MLRKHRTRRAVAAVEFAFLAPFLAFLFVIAIDWGRVFYYSIIINNCARNGALYSMDPYSIAKPAYANVTAAALADAGDVSPAPAVTTTSGTDAGVPYVDCTVSYNFQTVTNFPGVPHSNPIVRTVRVYQAPQVPQ